MRNDRDLVNKVPEFIVENQKPSHGQGFILEINGLLHKYYHDEDLFIVERLFNKIKAELGWFERISNHAPSIGEYYEHLLASAVQEMLPSNLQLGRGFIYDSGRRVVSPQIDLIIYKNDIRSEIYKRANFVVIDSENVVSCVEVKKTLTKSILKKVISKYINVNLGTSPLALRGIQFLNIFTFYSKLSLPSIVDCIKTELLKFFESVNSETVGGDKVKFILYHLVLPRLFFLNKNYYIYVNVIPTDNQRIKVKISVNKSSDTGHSLGEFINSVISEKKDDYLYKKDFLTFPLIEVDKEEVVSEDLLIMQYFTMADLESLFSEDVNKIRNQLDKTNSPYGALISSSIEDLQIHSLANLEKSGGLIWLRHNNYR